MKNHIEPSLLKKERQLTDESLVVERGKTDESFVDHSQKAEGETDKAVEKDRLRADKATLQRRSEADFKNDTYKTQLKPNDKKVGQTAEERLIEDATIETQRSSIDAAMEREREVKHAQLETLLTQREDTDKNLLSERVKTDVQSKQAAGLLKDEQAAHLNTKAALTTRDEFLAIVSHDLRNPVGAISSCAEMLLADADSVGIGEKARPWIELVKRNADLSLRLISDILDLERIAHGKLKLQKQQNDIAEILNDSVSSLSYLANAKNISLKVTASSISSKLICDRDRISQILSNLIGNALKFTPSGGRITVSAESSENEVKILVCDSGPGIPEDQQRRIFDRYAQLQNKDREGLGLGLYISKTLVELHGGKISVFSSGKQGSTFCFTLPIKIAAEADLH